MIFSTDNHGPYRVNANNLADPILSSSATMRLRFVYTAMQNVATTFGWIHVKLGTDVHGPEDES